ncbi:POT family proton-dependent oligopeptide transporter [Microbacterium sp. W4I20]|nr:POT family proton-dependent oligopeptide transporter [Microbacterium sp. W4I20]
MSTSQTARPGRDENTRFFGQPCSLVHIFGVEMWERFSFYGMQGILLIYLYYSATQGGLGIPEAVAGGIVGAYGGSVYLSTILGAWLADRLFGSERVLFFSAIVIVAGHVALALIPGVLGVGVGLVLVALGSGGLKANATSVVGTLYKPDDPRRDAGFSLFYLGINLGAFLGPILTGILQSTLGFHWGFGLAAVGMTLGLVQYSFGRRSLPEVARQVPNPLPASRYRFVVIIAVAAIVLIAVLVLVGVIRADNLATIVIGGTVVAAIAYFAVILSSRRIDASERSRVWGFLPLFVTSVAFWSLYQQQFTVLTIYSDKRLDRNLFGIEVPVSIVQSINPVFIIILSGVFAAIWTRPRHPPALDAGEVRSQRDHHGIRVPAVPPVRERGCEHHADAGDRRHPVRVHGGGAAALPGGTVGHDQARSCGFPDPDGGVVLPVHRAGYRDLGRARPVLRPRERGALLRDPGQHRRRRRRRPAPGREAGAEAHEGCALSVTP